MPARGARVSGASAIFLGWTVVAVLNVVDISSRALPARGGLARLGHYVFDLGHVLAVALAAALGAALWRRFAPTRSALRTVSAPLLVALVSALLAQVVLPDDLAGAVERFGSGKGALYLACALASLVVPLCYVLGRVAARYRLRSVGVMLGLAFIAANPWVLRSGYPGLHLLLAASGATLIAASLAGVALTGRALPARAQLRVQSALSWDGAGEAAKSGPRWRRLWPAALATLLSVGFALATVLVKPPSAVFVQMLERDTTVLLPWLRGWYAPAKIGNVSIPYALRAAFQSRKGRPDLAPASTPWLRQPPIVIFITIDALRLEVFEPKYKDIAPNLQEIKRNSVYFSQARSSGSDTRFSLAALFAGRHYSMLNWNWSRSRGRPTLERDLEPRLPELLQRAHVKTATFVAVEKMLVPRIGIVRGFDEQFDESPDLGEIPRTQEIVDQAIERLRRHNSEPLFLYSHIIDPHAPYYRRGAKVDSEHDAYLVEVALSDRHVGRLRKAIRELGLADRTALIIGSDHGEGFGEHGVFHHNKTLYEVMVHVPLMIEIPGVKPRVVDDFVSLMDMGPTIFDLFHVPTPGWWMADSLVPVLKGGRMDPNRVILMEKPKEKAMLFPDGLKVISRGSAEEIYDVLKDPDEQDNLWDSLGEESRRRMGLLRAYIDLQSGRSDAGEEDAE